MANLRDTTSRANATFYPGTGKPPEEVDLKKMETDITPYMIDPTLAKQEADVVKSRYGGKAIQDSPGGSPEFYQPPADNQQQAPRLDFSNRPAYEQIVLKQLGGNPFDRDPVAELNQVTEAEIPNIFNTIFNGQVSWEDRNRLDPAQQKHLDNEIKKFRAHVHDGINSEIQNKINIYNQLMNRFDNERKYYEAATKRVESQAKEMMTQARQEQKDRVARYDKLSSDRLRVNKELMEIMLKYQEYSQLKGGDSVEAQAALQQYDALMQEKQRLSDELESLSGPGAGPKGKQGQPSAKEKKIVKRKILPDGRKAVEYEDGSREIVGQ